MSLQFREKIMPENINDFSLGSLPFNAPCVREVAARIGSEPLGA
jgi:hypothetical protein